MVAIELANKEVDSLWIPFDLFAQPVVFFGDINPNLPNDHASMPRNL